MNRGALAGLVRRLLPDGEPVASGLADAATSAPGAYALLIGMAVPLRFDRGQVSGHSPPGWYVYAGSARGPGGIRARIARHFRSTRKPHWHVDELTCAAWHVEALAIPGGSECAIVARLAGSGCFVPALAGFGSSDCRCCDAHLLAPASS